MTNLEGRKVVVRGIQSGVYFGTLKDSFGGDVIRKLMMRMEAQE